jgi:hypothetical protein
MNIPGKSLNLLIMLAVSICILCSCSSPAPSVTYTPTPTQTNIQITPTPSPKPIGANYLEVVYFHRTQRCYSCQYAGDTTKYATETYFAQELANGKMVFKTLNLQDQANAEIVKKYGAYTSSLFINQIKGGTDHIDAVTDIWLLIGKDEAFVNLVKSKIESALENT